MLVTLRVRPQIRARLSGGPLSEHVEAFVAVLRDEGYARGVIRRYIHAVDVFGRWLAQRQISAQAVAGAIVAQFVSSLKRPRSPGRPHGRPPGVASGVRKFAAFLWATGVAIRHRPSPETEIERWLRGFDEYLARVGGASGGTRRIYRRYARAFLTARFGPNPPDWSAVTTDDITEFVRLHAAALSPAANRAPATAIRTFLRYLTAIGVVRAGLDGAIPPVRSWKLVGVPRALTPDELQRVLAACDRTPTAATRDRVVLLLLARLGLRASEVAALRIDDIDWHEGHLVIRPGKSGRERRLPLPHDVGEHVVHYLRQRRAASGRRTLFVSAHPPHGPITAGAISGIAQRALRRAGVTVAHPGAHPLRHTAATQLVRQGVPFKAVADVLGHARLETTAIYAKLDLPRLAGVALPWPGGAS